MAILINSSFAGVGQDRGNPNSPVVASDITNLAGDCGLCMEVLTNKKGDNSGGTATTSGHAHGLNDGEGNMMFVALATDNYGPQSWDLIRNPGTFDSFQIPPTIYENSGSSSETVNMRERIFFIPRGFENREILVVCEVTGTAGDPGMMATLSTWGTTSPPSSAVYSTETPVSGSIRIPFTNALTTDSSVAMMETMGAAPDGNYWVAVVTAASSGLHTLKVEKSVRAFDVAVNHTVTMMNIFAALPASRLPVLSGRVLPGKVTFTGTNQTVGDADSTSTYDYEPVYDTLAAADSPTGPTAPMVNRNLAVIEEWARGLPAAGNASLTVAAGHAHTVESGNPYGKRVEMSLGSWALGSAETGTSLTTQARNKAPSAATTTAQRVFDVVLYTPKYTEANTRLYCAALVCLDSSKGTNPVVAITSDPNLSGASTTTVTLTGDRTAGSGGRFYQVITSATQMNMQSGGKTGFTATLKLSAAVAANVALVSLCLFIDE